MRNTAGAKELMAQASAARGAGRAGEAIALVRQAIAAEPASAAAWNLLGLLQLENGDPAGASASLRTALQHDAAVPVIWLNLSRAFAAIGDHQAELDSLDQAIARDNYFLPALVLKGQALRRLGREPEAVLLYRALLAGIADDAAFPPTLRAQLDEARELVRRHDDRRHRDFAEALGEVAADFPGADLSRVERFAEQRAGRRKVYVQQPTAGHFPYLPAIEFFDRGLFPWFERLEAATASIRDELVGLWAQDDPSFRPYITYAPGMPLNQWQELNHSPRWSAWFFWEDGRRVDENCARCPQTAALIDSLPLLDVPGKGPTAMFSVLQPRTRIPAHTGSSNIRTTVHLPLIVPGGCGFRVGAETRAWREGEAWAFDDTIEHEAWNDSDEPRAILIVDCWNPLLSDAERAAVRRIG